MKRREDVILPIDEKLEEKRYSEFEQSQDKQLDFFHFVEARDREYSNTVHLYDALPKYTVSPHALKRFNDEFLRAKHSELKYKGETYQVTVFPARVKDWRDGVERDFLPGKNEEVLEDVIRKISLDHHRRGKYVDKHYSVVFTNKEVLAYLKRAGHEMSLRQLKHSLKVLSRSTLLVETKGQKKALLEASLFPVVGQVDEGDEEAGKTFVVFNPLVTHEIVQGNFHLLHLDKCLSLKRYLSRWLFKRLSQRYTQASYKNPFGPINYSTIQRDSGGEEYAKTYIGIKYLEKALEELIEQEVITHYDKNLIKEGRKVIDAAFRLWPHPEFVKNMKYSNRRYTQMKSNQQVRKLVSSD